MQARAVFLHDHRRHCARERKGGWARAHGATARKEAVADDREDTGRMGRAPIYLNGLFNSLSFLMQLSITCTHGIVDPRPL